jgi:transcriptional regulator with XRE-family HTH domain
LPVTIGYAELDAVQRIQDKIGKINRNRNTVMIFLPVQCQMARAALGWGVRELAAAAKVSVDTLSRFERGEALKERTVEAIQHALEAAGIEFIPENGGGPGVRLRKPVTALAQPAKAPKPGSAVKATPRKKAHE